MPSAAAASSSAVGSSDLRQAPCTTILQHVVVALQVVPCIKRLYGEASCCIMQVRGAPAGTNGRTHTCRSTRTRCMEHTSQQQRGGGLQSRTGTRHKAHHAWPHLGATLPAAGAFPPCVRALDFHSPSAHATGPRHGHAQTTERLISKACDCHIQW